MLVGVCVCVCIYIYIYKHTHTHTHTHRIFGHEGCEADDIIYINWLNMARAGLLALEFYSPDTQSWGQVGLLNIITFWPLHKYELSS